MLSSPSTCLANTKESFSLDGDLEPGLFSEDEENSVFGLSRFRMGILRRLTIFRISRLSVDTLHLLLM